MRKIIVAALAVLTMASPAVAEVVAPPDTSHTFREEEPLGKAQLRFLGFHVYDIALWCDCEQWVAYKKPFALSIRYAMSFDPEQLARRSVEEMERQEKFTPEEAEAAYTTLKDAFPAVTDDDIITALYIPGKALKFYFNGTLHSQVKDMKLAQRFMAIWLGEQSSYADIARALRGEAGS